MKTLTQNQTEFIEKIKKVYEECVGHESYGSTTEFFDEDGVVLMTAEADGINDKVIFSFNDEDGLVFELDSNHEALEEILNSSEE